MLQTLCVRHELDKIRHVNATTLAVLEEMFHKFQDKRTVVPCFDEVALQVLGPEGLINLWD